MSVPSPLGRIDAAPDASEPAAEPDEWWLRDGGQIQRHVVLVDAGGQDADSEYVNVSRTAIFDDRLSAEAVRVLAILGAYANANGESCPSAAVIGARLGVGKRVIFHHLRILREAGYLRSDRRGGRVPLRVLQGPQQPAVTEADAVDDVVELGFVW